MRYTSTIALMLTWDLKQEVISHRVTCAAFLNDHSCQEVVVVNWNSSVIVYDEGRAFFWNLL